MTIAPVIVAMTVSAAGAAPIPALLPCLKRGALTPSFPLSTTRCFGPFFKAALFYGGPERALYLVLDGVK
jgi:hypothetical protein